MEINGKQILVEGKILRIARPYADPQEEWFQDEAVNAAKERDLIPGPGQCIGFSTPVVFAEGGGLDSAYIADLYEHVGFLGDIHKQISTLPGGAKVRLVVQTPKNNS